MNAIIFCPGPSLRPGIKEDECDLAIGVNRAVSILKCHWWSCGDSQTIAETKRLGSPSLLTGRSVCPEWKDGRFNTEDLFRFLPHTYSYSLYSSTTAAVFAASRGASAINVYGCEML